MALVSSMNNHHLRKGLNEKIGPGCDKAADGFLPGSLAEQPATTERVKSRVTVGDLLRMFEDLLPRQVDLCADLVAALKGSQTIAASVIAAEPEEVWATLVSHGAPPRLFREGQFSPHVPVDSAYDYDNDCKAKAAIDQNAHNGESWDVETAPRSGLDSRPTSPRTADGAGSRKFSSASVFSVPVYPTAAMGNFRFRLFLVLEEPSLSIIGKVIGVLLILAIAVSTVSFVLESMPTFRETPPECAVSRTVRNCEPRPFPSFATAEAICIAIFTIDYVLRILLVHSSPVGESGILLRTLVYAVQPLNIVDLAAIMPFYLNLLLDGGAGAVRVLRLIRILRPFKAAKRYPGFMLLADVMVMSGRPLMILVFFNAIITVLFGSLVFFAEGMRFSVASQFTMPDVDPLTNGTIPAPFPTGAFVRHTAQMDGEEATPFRSIPYSIWWVLVTMTTVGYGDYAPTSVMGKIIGVACFYVGIIFLALPISVLGTNFEMAYNEKTRTSRKRAAPSYADFSRLSREGEIGFLPRCNGWRRKIFTLLEDSSASKLGKFLSIAVIALIVVSTVAFIMESMPDFSFTPDVCTPDNLSISNCKPVPNGSFYVIEAVCIGCFTVEYMTRVLTVHVMADTPEQCGVKARRSRFSGWSVTFWYMTQYLNIIDILAIVPFYVEMAGGVGSGAGVLRVLRLIRIFRVLKMPKMRACVEMFISVIADALPALILLFFMTSLMCVLYASLIVFAEGSHYSVDHFVDDYPNGVYIRPTRDGYGLEPSPFKSVLYAFWWFFTTATTVGYGDDVPTTTAGRIVAVCTFYTGIVLLALPITIINGCFNEHYPLWVKEFGYQASQNAFEECENDLSYEASTEARTGDPIPPHKTEFVKDSDLEGYCADKIRTEAIPGEHRVG